MKLIFFLHFFYKKCINTRLKLFKHISRGIVMAEIIEKNEPVDFIREIVANDVKNAAYEIIERKKATYYGIAMAVKRICECIVRDEKSVLPVSNRMHGAFGIEDITLSMPAVVGKNGIEIQMPITLSESEASALKKSAEILKQTAAKAGI